LKLWLKLSKKVRLNANTTKIILLKKKKTKIVEMPIFQMKTVKKMAKKVSAGQKEKAKTEKEAIVVREGQAQPLEKDNKKNAEFAKFVIVGDFVNKV
jgi:hypothetical protein